MSAAPDIHRSYVAELTPEHYDVIKSLAAEKAALCLRFGQEPSPVDLFLLALDEPVIIFEDKSTVTAMVRYLQDYADDTAYATEQFAGTWPNDMAAMLIEDREARAGQAQNLAGVLLRDSDFVDAVRGMAGR